MLTEYTVSCGSEVGEIFLTSVLMIARLKVGVGARFMVPCFSC